MNRFHNILIKTIPLRELTLFQMVNFHKQRAITPECIVQYKPLSNLKKTLWYLAILSFIKIMFKTIRLRERTSLGVT